MINEIELPWVFIFENTGRNTGSARRMALPLPTFRYGAKKQ
jgi:hypothetical protein